MRPSPQPLNELTWAVTDVETTGLSPAQGDRVCEVAVVRAGPGGVQSFQTLIHPGRPIPPEASRINGITDAMVAEAPAFAEAAPEVIESLRGAVFVSHNVPFDQGFLRAEFDACGRPFVFGPSVDTVTLARRLLPLPSNRLEEVAGHFGISIERRHRALGDAAATWAVLERFLDMLAKRGVRTLEDLLRGGARGPSPGKSNALRSSDEPAGIPSGEINLEAVAAALEAGTPLRLTYLSYEGRRTDRTVEPLDLFEEDGRAYLEAFCRLRREKRTFRLDRILDIDPA